MNSGKEKKKLQSLMWTGQNTERIPSEQTSNEGLSLLVRNPLQQEIEPETFTSRSRRATYWTKWESSFSVSSSPMAMINNIVHKRYLFQRLLFEVPSPSINQTKPCLALQARWGIFKPYQFLKTASKCIVNHNIL